MIITMIAMRMVQMSIDQVIDMIAVRDCFVPTVWTVDMASVMAAALVGRRARRRIGVADFDDVFFHRAISVHMVQMAIVQIIDMITMLDTSVFAVGTVDVVMVGVSVGHPRFPFRGSEIPSRA